MTKPRFHFEINLGHVLILVGLLIQGVVYTTSIKGDLNSMKKDVDHNTADIVHQQLEIDKLSVLQETASQQLAVQQEQLRTLQATIGVHR